MFPFFMHRVTFSTMSLLHLPVQIARLLDTHQISQRELARRCEISNGTINKILDGQRCSSEILTLIISKLCTDESERYSLICSHLRDEVVRAGGDPTHVVIRHVDGADLGALDLTPEMNAFIGTLAREAECDETVADVIEGLSDLLVERAALRADLEAKVVNPPGAKKTEEAKAQRDHSTPPTPKSDATG